MRRFALSLALAVVSSLVLAACSGPQTATLDVELKEFEFLPSSLKVPAGADLTINLTNTGTIDHEMVVFKKGVESTPPVSEEFIAENVYWEAELEAGMAQAFQLKAPAESGEYLIICGIPGHYEAGMAAILAVTE